MENPETISIPQSEYNELMKEVSFLRALQWAGIDNWDGYDYAIELFNKEFPQYKDE